MCTGKRDQHIFGDYVFYKTRTILMKFGTRGKHFKFHKIAWRHYSAEVENVCMMLQQIYSGNYVSNLIRIAWVLQKILQKTFWSLFFRTQCTVHVSKPYANRPAGEFWSFITRWADAYMVLHGDRRSQSHLKYRQVNKKWPTEPPITRNVPNSPHEDHNSQLYRVSESRAVSWEQRQDSYIERSGVA